MKNLVYGILEFSFSNFFYLIPRLIICLYFLFLMPGSALNLALKLVVRHDVLENVKRKSSVTPM